MRSWGPPDSNQNRDNSQATSDEAPKKSLLRRLLPLVLLAALGLSAIYYQPIRQPIEAFLKQIFGG